VPIPAASRCLWYLLAALCLSSSASAAYDPLAQLTTAGPTLDLEVRDTRRNRQIPLRVYLSADAVAAPVLLFSHGLGGSREGSSYLGQHWARRGYVAVFLQHPGSDEGVWRDPPAGGKMAAMRKAASGANLLLRVKDVSAVIDQLTRWNRMPGHPLQGRLDMTRLGMSGHSFGAVTTQAVSGQTFAGGGASVTDKRIKAAIAMSPSGPRRGGAAQAFGSVRIPWMTMTGTLDVAQIGGTDVASRLAVFPALPPGGKYELVLDAAEHSAFTDRSLAGTGSPRNPNHHRAILALSTAFWDAWLRGDAQARQWLDGAGPATVLESGDRWQRK
jgi:dienelactone hydrolase